MALCTMRHVLRSCGMSVVRASMSSRLNAPCRSSRSWTTTAVAARLAPLPRRQARPSCLRALQAGAGLAEAEQQADSVAGAAEDVQHLAAAGVLEAALTWPARTHGCGALSEAQVNDGSSVTVCGWVDRYRNLGGLIFLDIRDHTGIIQVIVDPQQQPEVAAKAERLRAEYVVAIAGCLRLRKDPNPRMKTGSLEISPSDIKVRGLQGLQPSSGLTLATEGNDCTCTLRGGCCASRLCPSAAHAAGPQTTQPLSAVIQCVAPWRRTRGWQLLPRRSGVVHRAAAHRPSSSPSLLACRHPSRRS
jgi:hypothetical protein